MERLLMAAKDMTDALQNPHPEVPFASVGDDTISALVDLAAIIKLDNKLRLPLLKLCPHRSYNNQALLHHQTKS
jgi:hypothetical protein